MSFYYLATPYSKYQGGIEAAYIEACKQTAILLRAGVPIFSPIAHTHGVAIHGEVDPLDHDVWLPADRPMMDAAKLGLIVCMMDGWAESYGVRHEIAHFRSARRPVLFMEPGSIPSNLQAA